MMETAKTTGTFKSFDDTPIYYEVRGSGPPLVLCYGIACLMNHWAPQLRYFSQQYQTIVFDYRGHHRTPAPKEQQNLSLAAIVSDIRGLLEHLEVKQASFWGHSYGVQVLLGYYDQHPETVRNLVFINGFAANPIKSMFGGVFSGRYGLDAMGPALRLFKEGHKSFPDALSALWRSAVTHPLAIQLSSLAGGFNLGLTAMKDIEVYARGVAAMDIDVFITLFEEMMAYDGTSVLEKISVPTLLISGAKDGVTPKEHQEEMHRRIRDSEFLRVPYGSHCTQLDFPEFVNLRIEKFLQDHQYQKQKASPKRKPARPWGDL